MGETPDLYTGPFGSLASVSHLISNQWATTSPTSEPYHLSPVSLIIYHQWAITSPISEPSHLPPGSLVISHQWATTSNQWIFPKNFFFIYSLVVAACKKFKNKIKIWNITFDSSCCITKFVFKRCCTAWSLTPYSAQGYPALNFPAFFVYIRTRAKSDSALCLRRRSLTPHCTVLC